MKVTVKILKGGECSPEMREKDTVFQLKCEVEAKLNIPPSQQRLVYKGKTLLDDKSLQESGVTPGSKIFLMVKKAEDGDSPAASAAPSDFWRELHTFLIKHFKPDDALKVAEEFKKEYETNMASLSLDDIEKIATHNLHRMSTSH